MIDGQPARSQNSHSAAALHARLQAATRDARLVTDQESQSLSRPRRRLTAGEPWALMQSLQHSGGSVDRTLSMERALRRVLASLLAEGSQANTQTDIDAVEGPVLVIRSGPWPVLRALLARLATNELARPITVLCHRRDESALAALSAPEGGLGLDVRPLFYTRFEPFNTSTLRRVLTGGAWRTTFVLDASRTGRGESLEHVTTAVSSRDAHVWNAGGTAWRQRTLRERLSRENYALVRGLLQWHARREPN